MHLFCSRKCTKFEDFCSDKKIDLNCMGGRHGRFNGNLTCIFFVLESEPNSKTCSDKKIYLNSMRGRRWAWPILRKLDMHLFFVLEKVAG